MKNPDVKLLIIIVLVAGLAGAAWIFRDDLFPRQDEPIPVVAEPAVELTPVDPSPAYPLNTSEPTHGELVPLPPLDDSDAYFLLALLDIFGSDVDSILVNEALIDRFVTTVDNLTRRHVAEKIRPVGRLAGNFDVATDDAAEVYYQDPANYRRYDLIVGLIASADIASVTEMYRRFYPLFQESYERLGYPDAYFNDRVVEVIDHLLTTPTPEEPLALLRPHVLYVYADADLEALSSGQKLLLRMGGEHAATIKQVLQLFRAKIVRLPE